MLGQYSFRLSTVYGPTSHALKDEFFSELMASRPQAGTKWLVNGDFNQIYRARDKSNRNICLSRMNRFRDALASCELKEIHLQNRRFTWSNERNTPTLCKLDSFFCNAEWDLHFNDHILHALSSSLSDHCPLLLVDDRGPKRPRTFKFENFWIKLPGFLQVVRDAWDKPVPHTEPCHKLYHKLANTGKSLRKWSRGFFSEAKLQLHMALSVILRLDEAQDTRPLSPAEADIRRRLKRRVISLAVLERSRKKQCARITNLKEGDANTRFFHRKVNARRRKNFIHRLCTGHGWATKHEDKEQLIQQHFTSTFAKGPTRTRDFIWESLPLPMVDLSPLGEPFTELEVWEAIKAMPGDKAPGPDGFSGAFFKSCWTVIKDDLMDVILAFSNLQSASLHWLNSANIALLPKKDGAQSIGDFRPISLIHAVAKIIAKILASRLAPFMNKLTSRAQSAFIKTRSIHDNFLFVRNYARRLQRTKTSALLCKLDIKKAFDSVSWEYMFDLLQRLGFPPRFRDWLAALWSSASSRIILNGIPGKPMPHGCGLRQGDPVSPLLFVLAIDPLQYILEAATTNGDLHRLRGRGPFLRTSLYADDAAIFLAPIKEDVNVLSHLLNEFGHVTGLVTNVHKSMVAPIRCSQIDLDVVLANFPASRSSFPMKYLGLPLSIHNLRAIDFQPLLDKMRAKLTAGNGANITMAGRNTYAKSSITSQAIHHLIPLHMKKGVLHDITRIIRAFLWAGTDKVNGGKCKVRWEIVCRPTSLGGLGILELDKFSRALRLRWPWWEWKDPERAWIGLGTPCDDEDMDLFYKATSITIGDGKTAKFWHAPWLGGAKPKDIAPSIFNISRLTKGCVQKAMHNDEWVRHINTSKITTAQHISEFVALWEKVTTVQLQENTPDEIVWTLNASGVYDATSAYRAQFEDLAPTTMNPLVWKNWAPPKCKTFAWLVLQDRVWTADRLQRRGWPNCGECQLCKVQGESAAHMLFKCRYSVRIWRMIQSWLGLDSFNPDSWSAFVTVKEWWSSLCLPGGRRRRALSSLFLLVVWELWNERNARVFRGVSSMPSVVFAKIKHEASLWGLAGAKHLRTLMPRE
jgi:hypothetical protein